jgi:3-dehydroquinate synthase
VQGFREWASRFPALHPVSAGEQLKSLESFGRHLRAIDRKIGGWPGRRIQIVAAGGGSVGDFTGFLASVYRRGVGLAHVPSTWLAAIDSAHGGKTALNLGQAKNQIGTFYTAQSVHLVRELLFAQPDQRAQEAMSELCKVALLDGRSWARALMSNGPSKPHLKDTDRRALLWRVLPKAIDSKMRIVRQDPTERLGKRRILNLGHTMAHVLELSSGVAHGAAVGSGLRFALEFSVQRGHLSARAASQWLERFDQLGVARLSAEQRLSLSSLPSLLARDKKRSNDGVDFVFLKALGRPVIERVAFRDLIDEADRQGWLK